MRLCEVGWSTTSQPASEKAQQRQCYLLLVGCGFRYLQLAPPSLAPPPLPDAHAHQKSLNVARANNNRATGGACHKWPPQPVAGASGRGPLCGTRTQHTRNGQRATHGPNSDLLLPLPLLWPPSSYSTHIAPSVHHRPLATTTSTLVCPCASSTCGDRQSLR